MKFRYEALLIVYFIFYLSVSILFVQNMEKPTLNWIAPDLNVFLSEAKKISGGEIPVINFTLADYPIGFGMLLSILSPFSQNLNSFAYAFAGMMSIFLFADSLLLLEIMKMLRLDKKRILFFLFSPTVLLFTWARFDMIPIFFLLLSLYAFFKNKNRVSGFLSGVGGLFKFFPLTLAAADFLNKRKIFVVALLAFILIQVPFLLINFSNAIDSYKFNLTRGFNPDSLSWILQNRLHLTQTEIGYLSVVILILSVLFIKLRGNILLTTIALIFITLWISRVFSPQYVAWVVPLLILTGIDLRYIVLLDFANVLVFPFSYPSFPAFDTFIILRSALMLLILYRLNMLTFDFRKNLLSLKDSIFSKIKI